MSTGFAAGDVEVVAEDGNRHCATASTSWAFPCTTFRFGCCAAGNRSVSLLGVRQSAMHVCPAAIARVSAARPTPPEAPRKAMVFLVLVVDEDILL